MVALVWPSNLCEEHNNFQDSKSIFMMNEKGDFWFIVGLTATLRLLKMKNSTFL